MRNVGLRRGKLRSAKQLIIVPLLLSFAAVGWAQCQKQRPSLVPVRYDEDWSLLANPDCKKEALDDLKYVPLRRENWYLSIGGEIRYRYENYDNPGFGTDLESPDGYI